MRIACPYCGERDNEEFTYLGDATVHAPATLRRAPDDAARRLDRLRLPARQPRRAASRALAARRRLPRLARRDARHATHAILGVELARDVAARSRPQAADDA